MSANDDARRNADFPDQARIERIDVRATDFTEGARRIIAGLVVPKRAGFQEVDHAYRDGCPSRKRRTAETSAKAAMAVDQGGWWLSEFGPVCATITTKLHHPSLELAAPRTPDNHHVTILP